LELFLAWCKEEGIGGLSVTIPHKQTILPLLDQAESAAQGIGACNTVVFANNEDKELIGYNTDYRAAMDCLTEAMAKWTGSQEPFERESVLILGAGGVSRAIGYGLSQRRASITVTSRNRVASESLAKHLNCRWIDWEDRHTIEPKILVNGTPVGMFPDMDETPFQTNKLKGATLVFDTVYNPEQTLFLKGARATGCPVISGLQMFVRQAAYQYRLFTGLEPPVDVMVKTLKKAISPVNYKDLDEDGDEDSKADF
jgi:3-dehydroquinate dehydratase/shikimate dehydrogenase